jgi:hypothetical protein
MTDKQDDDFAHAKDQAAAEKRASDAKNAGRAGGEADITKPGDPAADTALRDKAGGTGHEGHEPLEGWKGNPPPLGESDREKEANQDEPDDKASKTVSGKRRGRPRGSTKDRDQATQRDFSKEFAKAEKNAASDKADKLEPAELIDMIADADEVEIAFVDSDGKELVQQPYEPADRDTWAIGPGGDSVQLNAENIELGAVQAPSTTLGGYVLLLDGEPVAVVKRDAPLRMGAGMTFDLSKDISFR